MAIMVLDCLPDLVLEKILTYLKYQEIVSISQVNSFLNNFIKQRVICEINLPYLQPRPKTKKSILRVNVTVILKSDQIENLQEQMDRLKLDKIGEVAIFMKTPGQISHDPREEECSANYHKFCDVLFTKILMDRIRKLRIGMDFVCVDCRRLLQLEPIDRFSTFESILPNLETLKLQALSSSVSPTVGLYAYFIKKILKHERLKHFYLTDIPDEIFDELRLWFDESRAYFRSVRNFCLKPMTRRGELSLYLYPIA